MFLTTLKHAYQQFRRPTVTIRKSVELELRELYNAPAHKIENPKLLYLRENCALNRIELVIVAEHIGQKEKEERYFVVDELNCGNMLSFLAQTNLTKLTKKHMEKLDGNTFG